MRTVSKIRIAALSTVVAVLAGAGGWFAARHSPARAPLPSPSARKVFFYQDAMHPWIKFDRPGKCTICGMALSPVEEEKTNGIAAGGLVTLGSNLIQVAHIQTAVARRLPLRRTVRVAGSIDENDSRHRILSVAVDGRIDKLHVNFIGAEVTQGQPLATIYSLGLLTAERGHSSLVKQMRDFPEINKNNQTLLTTSVQRLKQLGLSERQIDALSKKADDNILSDIQTPMTGTVVARFVYEGQHVKEGDKLFEIADFSTMWFRFDAYERDVTSLAPGQRVEVIVPALPGRVFTAPIVFIEPNLAEGTRSAKVRVEIPNPIIEENGRSRRLLLNKMYAEGLVQTETGEALVVARSAVLSPGSTPVVYVDKGGQTYEQRRVKLGRAGDEYWEVLEGLTEGERVVTSGNLLIDAQTQLNLK